ncbi:hypothetical protein [Agromyces marinus]|uniref:hypothetical protein n=1 Tax=Agromyces marinus TaxID=1389020 RepID=UPI001F3D35EF|nr:hypothetical protein [Agromyces marinus]UIP59852.1 hypothetical protein DSM26151_27660 [Agromyces marinus]
MDWTFWVGGAVILILVIASQVFLHESRWSRRRRGKWVGEPGEERRTDDRGHDGPDRDRRDTLDG